MDSVKNGRTEVSPTEVSPAEIRLGEVDTSKINPAEVQLTQVHLAQIDADFGGMNISPATRGEHLHTGLAPSIPFLDPVDSTSEQTKYFLMVHDGDPSTAEINH